MKKILSLSLVISALLLSACNTTPTKDIEVTSALAVDAQLKNYHSYSWAGFAAVLNDPEEKWQPADIDVSASIKSLIDRELQKKNLTNVENDESDLAISFFTGVDMEAQSLETAPNSDVEIPKNMPKAALVIIAIDTKTNYVVWVGVATGDVITKPTAETMQARLDYAITEVFNAKATRH